MHVLYFYMKLNFLKSDMFYANFSKIFSKIIKMKIEISVRLNFKASKCEVLDQFIPKIVKFGISFLILDT